MESCGKLWKKNRVVESCGKLWKKIRAVESCGKMFIRLSEKVISMNIQLLEFEH